MSILEGDGQLGFAAAIIGVLRDRAGVLFVLVEGAAPQVMNS